LPSTIDAVIGVDDLHKAIAATPSAMSRLGLSTATVPVVSSKAARCTTAFTGRNVAPPFVERATAIALIERPYGGNPVLLVLHLRALLKLSKMSLTRGSFARS
jgi:hypothetical protein